jgi:hypothetical protein
MRRSQGSIYAGLLTGVVYIYWAHPLGMQHISDIYGPHLLCGAEDGCDKHLMKLVDALSIKVVVALGRYAEKRARATLEGRNVWVAYLLHPSPRNDMPGSDCRAHMIVNLMCGARWQCFTCQGKMMTLRGESSSTIKHGLSPSGNSSASQFFTFLRILLTISRRMCSLH